MNIANKLARSFLSFQDHIAVSDESRSVTYASLHQQCAKVAAHIQQCQLHHSFIAIEVDDAIDHIIALLGILFSGNAYVSVTEENKPFLSRPGSLPVALTISSKELMTEDDSVCINQILQQAISLHDQEDVLTANDVQPGDPLCAFFTSGSTGISKTIVHSHQTIVADTIRQVKSNDITPDDKLDLVFSMSFSASLACIFPALFSGAELAVFDLKKQGLHQFARFWEEKRITFSTLSVSSFQGVCKTHPSLHHLTSLRFISISTEPVKDTTLAFFKTRFPSSSVLQIAYATTETRTISELKIYNNGTPQAYPESMGKPVEDKLVFITDVDGNQLPPNTVGEICAASAYIANGYWNEPEASKRSFAEKEGMPCFHTGDAGYLNEDGYLFYMGRTAHEYKLNGIKINISDIECAAEHAAGIAQAAAVICNTTGQPKLVCFYTFVTDDDKQSAELAKQQIRLCISSQLPQSHQPQFYIPLPQMPLTHSGKIDRKALEKIDPIAHLSTTSNIAFSNKNQEKNTETVSVIIEIFKKILETNNINGDSDFFNCGGESLTCLVCIAEMETALHVQLSNYIMASHSTPNKLGVFIITQCASNKSLVEIKRLNGHSDQKRNLYFLHHLQDSIFQPLITGQLSEHFNLLMCYYDLRHLHETENAADALLSELTTIIEEHDNPVILGYSVSGYLAYQIACVLPGITYAMIDTYNYFEPERYLKKTDLPSRLKTFYWHLAKNKDFGYPWFLVHLKYEWITGRKKPWNDEHFFAGVNYLVARLTHPAAQNNCIYFQASRHDRDFGASWKSYVRGRFYYRSLKATHHTIIKDHAANISDYIIRTA